MSISEVFGEFRTGKDSVLFFTELLDFRQYFFAPVHHAKLDVKVDSVRPRMYSFMIAYIESELNRT